MYPYFTPSYPRAKPSPYRRRSSTPSQYPPSHHPFYPDPYYTRDFQSRVTPIPHSSSNYPSHPRYSRSPSPPLSDDAPSSHEPYSRSPPKSLPARRPKSLPFDTAISNLSAALSSTNQALDPFRQEFEREVESLKTYSPSPILDSLWAARFAYGSQYDKDNDDSDPESASKKKGNKSGKRNKNKKSQYSSDAEDEDGNNKKDLDSDLFKNSQSLRAAFISLTTALTAMAYAQPCTTSDFKDTPEAEDKPGMERAIAKLRTVGPECVKLMRRARTEFGEVVNLMEELVFVRDVVNKWEAFFGDDEEEEEQERE